MILKHYQRGDCFGFTAEPVDSAGDSVSPALVTLYVNFLNTAGEREDATAVTMTTDTAGEVWSGEWTSRGTGAAAGRVDWCVRTVNPDSADQASFYLDANLANPAD